MEYPISPEDARDKLAVGRLFQGLQHNECYKQLFKPYLDRMLEEADRKCHDYKIRADRGREAVIEYNTIKQILNFVVDGLENMKHATDYCKDNNISL